MSSPWPSVKLRDLLSPVSRAEKVDPSREYSLLGAHWYAQGLYTKETKLGSEIRANALYRVEEGDFVYNRLFAWKGSFALATEDNQGCYVSNEFPCFHIQQARLFPGYVRWYFRREAAWTEALGLSFGATPTSRNRLKQNELLGMGIPLPPLSEQRRIVARIEQLASKIEQARQLREEAEKERIALLTSFRRTAFADGQDWEACALEEACETIIDCLHSNPVYSHEGIPTVRSPDVGWGELFLNTARRTTEVEYERRTRRGEPREGDIIFVREGGGTGKVGIVKKEQRLSLGQRVVLLRPDKDKVIPRFFLHQMLSPFVYEDQILPLCMGSASPHLNIGALRQFRFFVPSLEDQARVVDLLDTLGTRLGDLERKQDSVAHELDALLPSILDKAFKGKL